MLKKILLLLFFISSPGLWASSPLDFGVIGTFTFPFYSGEGFQSSLDDIQYSSGADKVLPNPIVGFTVGPTVEYSFSPLLSLEGNLLLAGSGGGYVIVDEGDREAHLISEINMEIPLMAKLKKSLNESRTLYFMAGPQLSILLYESEFVQDGHAYDKQNNGKDAFNPVGIGILTALGWQAAMKRVDVVMEFRYAREFSNSLSRIGSNYQNVIGFGTGLKFGKREN